jgi:hypothetical protein
LEAGKRERKLEKERKKNKRKKGANFLLFFFILIVEKLSILSFVSPFQTHSDPLIRGSVAHLCGSFFAGFYYDRQFVVERDTELRNSLLQLLLQYLKDESSITVSFLLSLSLSSFSFSFSVHIIIKKKKIRLK